MGERDRTAVQRSGVLALLRAGAVGLAVAVVSLSCWSQRVTTPASVSVASNGGGQVSVPIEVPPGIAGLTPRLSLEYSSHGGNGAFGLGWGLAGLSSISRCPRTMAQDGVRGAVRFDMDDRYCLDGQRLMMTAGTSYGASGSEYRSERDQFIKVTASGTAGNGPQSFLVKTKDGLTMEFGMTADSRIEAQGKSTVRVWALNKVMDTVGNFMTVTYSEDATNGVFYPLRIDYTGNGATLPANSVIFTTQARSDLVPQYMHGSLVKRTLRIAKIETKTKLTSGEKLVKAYNLAYSDGPTSTSRLTSVTECDGSSTPICLPPVALGWQAVGTGFTQTQWATSSGSWLTTNLYVGDFNGDGKADMLSYQSAGTFKVILSNGSGFVEQTWSTPNIGWAFADPGLVFVGDFNGDGLTDIATAAGVGSTAISVYISSGIGFSQQYWNTATGDWVGAGMNFVADLNGDGRADLVSPTSGNAAIVRLSTGTGFTQQTWTISTASWPGPPVEVGGEGSITNYPPVWWGSASRTWTGDFNGDGKADIATYQPNSGSMHVRLTNAAGNGFDSQVWPVSAPGSAYPQGCGGYDNPCINDAWAGDPSIPVLRGDFNGDGKADLAFVHVTGLVVRLSSGTGFVEQTWPMNGLVVNSTSQSLWTGDFDGDGKTDIVTVVGTTMYTARSSGFGLVVDTSTVATQWPGPTDSSSMYRVGDFSGDGKADIAAIRPTNGTEVRVSASSAGTRVATVGNGLGAVTAIAYKPISDASVYTKDAAGSSAYPVVDLQRPADGDGQQIHVVSQVDASNAIGGNISTQYTYGGLKAERGTGREMLGFRWFSAKNLGTSVSDYQEFRQDWPYTGLVAKQEQRLAGAGNAGVLRRIVNSYAQSAGSAAAVPSTYPIVFVYPSSVVESGWDINGASLPVITTTNTFAQSPQYGNLTGSVVSNAADGSTKTTTNTYDTSSVSGGNWRIGRLTTAVVSSTSTGNLTRTKSYGYHSTTNLLTSEFIEPNVPNDCMKTTHTYDGYGNRQVSAVSACDFANGYAISSAGTARSSTQNFNAQTVVIDGASYAVSAGVFPTGSINPKNHTETREYDPRFGVPVKLTGPNGLVTTWTFDTFGRKTRETRSDGTYTTWTYRQCSETTAPLPMCPTGGIGGSGGATSAWVIIEQDFAVNQAVNGPEKRTFHDNLNRVLRVQTQGFNAASILQDTMYESSGRVLQKSAPYFGNPNLASVGDSYVWTTFTYDALNRITQESVKDPDAVGGVANTSTAYNGLSVTVTNAKLQIKLTTKNAQGQVAQVTDHLGSTITYTYDAVGNLLQTNAAGSITSMSYDQRDRKIGMNDPAMGAWLYSYNAFGELVYQRDSLNKSSTMAYDVLGRMISRTELDFTSNWYFDAKANGASCGVDTGSLGRLCQATTTAGYDRVHTYDNLGRLKETSTKLDAVDQSISGSGTSHSVLAEYDTDTGRQKSKTWASSGLKVEYSYTSQGYLSSVASVVTTNFPQQVKYDVMAMNAQSQVTRYRYGNQSGTQVETVDSRDPISNRLTARVATKDGAASGNVFNQSYQYDALSNLSARGDNITGVQEAFTYDYLNRLTMHTTLGGGVSPLKSTQVIYDTRGNIQYKSDVGQYFYDAARPNRMTNVTLDTHPLATVPLSATRRLSYVFDDYRDGAQNVNSVSVGNGNLEYTATLDTTNNRHTVRYETYNSFNMPSEFRYGNLTGPSCPAGYTLAPSTLGEICVKANAVTFAATVTYSCAPGQTLSGSGASSICTGTVVTPATPVYQCPAGYTLSGSTCTLTTTTAATASPYCPAGFTVGSFGGVSPACVYTSNANFGYCPGASGINFIGIQENYAGVEGNWVSTSCGYTTFTSYSCPAGKTLSGTNCIQTTTTTATIASYSCPAGQTVSGSTCVQNNGSVPATVTYSCPVNHTVTGSDCTRTSDTYAALTTTSAADRTVNYVYGPEHQRVRQRLVLSGTGTSAYFAGSTWYLNGEDSLGLSYEHEVRDNGMTLQRHFLSANGFVFAQITKESGTGAGANKTRYLHYDHLGSIAAISNAGGTVVERLAYDPWGKRREVDGNNDTDDSLVGVNTDRGYTLHEHIDEVGVINMNGRVYDPLIGRFMSADPINQAPYNLKAYNRYSYVWNNPLKLWDPSGYEIEDRSGAEMERSSGSVESATADDGTRGGIERGARNFIEALGRLADFFTGGFGRKARETLKDERYIETGLLLVAGSTQSYLTLNPLTYGVKTGSTLTLTVTEKTIGARVEALHGVLDPIAAGRRTTAVLDTVEGTRVLAAGGRDLSKAQRALMAPGEVAAKLPGAHAEVTALEHAAQNGLTPAQMAVSRTICGSCRAAIEQSGGQLTGPTTAMWPR